MRLSTTFRTPLAITAAALALALAAGCVDDQGDDETPTGEATQGLSSYYTETTYYSNASKTQEVGYCFSPSTCTGPSTTCTGRKTAYRTFVVNPC